MFKSTYNKGFQMTFENGWTISVQFGHGNYCDNQKLETSINSSMNHPIVECANAEIGIWDKDDNWYETDKVKGWVTPNEVAEWIEKVSRW